MSKTGEVVAGIVVFAVGGFGIYADNVIIPGKITDAQSVKAAAENHYQITDAALDGYSDSLGHTCLTAVQALTETPDGALLPSLDPEAVSQRLRSMEKTSPTCGNDEATVKTIASNYIALESNHNTARTYTEQAQADLDRWTPYRQVHPVIGGRIGGIGIALAVAGAYLGLGALMPFDRKDPGQQPPPQD